MEEAKKIQADRTDWIKYTFLEAAFRTTTKILQKIIGVLGKTFAHAFLASAIVGFTQALTSLLSLKIARKKIFPGWFNFWGACLFGVNATIATALSFAVFSLGGDVGINSFIMTLTIVPGALIDRFIFREKLNYIQWLGLFLAVFAGYSILGWPSLNKILALPIWIWLSFIIMLSLAFNTGIARKIKDINPLAKNFWGGLVTFALSLGGLIFLGKLKLTTDFSPTIQKLWLSSIISGVIVIGIWSFSILSYKRGAPIAFKGLIMYGTYLTAAMFLGIIIFNEPLTSSKLIGIPIYLLAYALMNKKSSMEAA